MIIALTLLVSSEELNGGNEHELGDAGGDSEWELEISCDLGEHSVIVVFLVTECVEFLQHFRGLLHLLEAALGEEVHVSHEFWVGGEVNESLVHLLGDLLAVEVEESLQLSEVKLRLRGFNFEDVRHSSSGEEEEERILSDRQEID